MHNRNTSKNEAFKTLEIPERDFFLSSNPEEKLNKVYKEKLKEKHPDKGGNTADAQELTNARDILRSLLPRSKAIEVENLALQSAVLNSNPEALRKLLYEERANPHMEVQYGSVGRNLIGCPKSKGPLIFMAIFNYCNEKEPKENKENQLAVIRILAEKTVLTSINNLDDTPFDMAVNFNDLDVFNILLESTARQEIFNNNNNFWCSLFISALRKALLKHNYELVNALSNHSSFNPSAQANNEAGIQTNLFMLICELDFLSAGVKSEIEVREERLAAFIDHFLIDNKIDINLANAAGETAFDVALKRGSPAVASTLINYLISKLEPTNNESEVLRKTRLELVEAAQEEVADLKKEASHDPALFPEKLKKLNKLVQLTLTAAEAPSPETISPLKTALDEYRTKNVFSKRLCGAFCTFVGLLIGICGLLSAPASFGASLKFIVPASSLAGVGVTLFYSSRERRLARKYDQWLEKLEEKQPQTQQERGIEPSLMQEMKSP